MFAQRFEPGQEVAGGQGGVDKLQLLKSRVGPLKRRRGGAQVRDQRGKEESEDGEGLEESEDDPSESSDFSEIEVDEVDEVEVDEVEVDEVEVDGSASRKHGSVLSRFQNSVVLQDQATTVVPTENSEDASAAAVTEDTTLHPLENIPQPAIVRPTLKPEITSAHHKSLAFVNTTKVIYDNSMVKPYSQYSDLLNDKLLQNIAENYSQETFPIQTAILDTILPTINTTYKITKRNFTRRVGDVLVNAATGSGKTLSYTIPLVQTLSSRTVNRLRALILVPTKPLIHQVYDTLTKLIKGTNIIVSFSKLENSLREEHQKLINSEPDILIVTPGRLVDHINLKSISLRNLKFLVLDEADRLLNQSFQNWCHELMQQLDTEKQNVDPMPGNVIKMVFSATLTTNTAKLHDLKLYNPRLFVTDSVKLYNLPPTLQEYNIHIPTAKSLYKPLFLLRLLQLKTTTEGEEKQRAKVLVFVKSNQNSLRLASLLQILNKEGDMTVHSINSNNSKVDNKRLLAEFSRETASSTQVLITTDLMSRGIDINNITDVVNYDVPLSSQQYVHRCGRTARANAAGFAYNLLVGKGERNFWSKHIDEDISRDVSGKHVEVSEVVSTDVAGDDEAEYKDCLSSLRGQVDGVKQD
ncbi:putative ATP-dependent RNA helicase DBP6 KNAG_0D00300 [Huiozyma naganishii CBS 8797]|uniref:ATP-dependent RNA helicase n=1 Tax=Huiozyma naganishii (strain ATCC MYA-139 / BCRC 22969 / CBS 8797 / KCTC 17520 / NBRC 10181 / NCYC 3082 / Yp74L-3) TaxID=1071383 RepID=J7RJU8_HUIN7|nr:hypothetical protein KNAG_0D00300 [Kazachstania naganishii CBS 8797]CCK69783.1 hypothetical protein KNAG_0D00300 [Kazachstania naganishii CBS 8797]